MKISPNDPKLTAYALGELEQAESAAIAAAVEQSLHCQLAVDEIRHTANWLVQELQNEPFPEVDAVDSAQLEIELEKKVVACSWWKALAVAAPAAIAACVLFGFILPGLVFSRKGKSHVLVKNEVNLPATSVEAVPDLSLPATSAIPSPQPTLQELSPPALPEALAMAPHAPIIEEAPRPFMMDIRMLQRYGPALLKRYFPEGSMPEMPRIPQSKRGSVPASSAKGVVTPRTAPNSLSNDLGAPLHMQMMMMRYGGRYGSLPRQVINTAFYEPLEENTFLPVTENPLSTFSIDVDTASYANVRRFLNQGQLPPEGAVRVEELINCFTYDYPQPKGAEPFSVNMEVAGCPWNQTHRLVRIGLKGREIAQDKRPPSNFVLLIDVSGSMKPAERLPLIKQALRMLVRKMTENDRVAIVVYASSSGLVLPSTSCAQKEKILEVIDRLEAGGSTNGGEGIQLAYRTAVANFIKGGVNRVILCTDGDFNVGITDQSSLVRLIEEQARSSVFLTALGVGTDNFKDATMQKLADKGNGNYHYLDSLEEAQKVLIQQMNGTLVTIAKDVKIQIEFNPAQVGSYRLIGYEKRRLRNEDFNDDTKDAGEIGAGHTVTALYEIVPVNTPFSVARVDPLKYQPAAKRFVADAPASKELLTLKLRYKEPDGVTSKLLEYPVTDRGASYAKASLDFKFAAAVASFGMLLRNSEHKGASTFDALLELADEGKGKDAEGYRAEFLNLVKKAKALCGQGGLTPPQQIPGFQ